ncbi:MAG: PQQ-binding-like beta-propeller repeat protein [Elusimicrobiota bacterium]
MNRLIKIIILIWSLAPAAYSADWPMFRGNVNRSGYTHEQAYPPGGSWDYQWKYNIGDNIVSSPVTARGMVYIGARDMSIFAFDAYTGEVVWQYSTSGWVDSTPLVSSGTVYLSCRDGNLYAFDALTGDIRWTYNTGSADNSSPVIAKGKIFFGAGYPRKEILALDAAAANLLWSYPVGQFVYSSPAVSGNKLFAGANDGKFYCLDSANGQSLWSFSTQGSIFFSSPAVENGVVYCLPGDDDRKLYALDINKGTMLSGWTTPDFSVQSTNVSSPAAARGRVYLLSGFSPVKLFALSAANGSVIWQKSLGNATDIGFLPSPAVVNDLVYAASPDGNLYVLKAGDGTEVVSKNLGTSLASSPCIANGWLYIGTKDGHIYAFKAERVSAISSPASGELFSGNVEKINIRGSAFGPNFSSYLLEYGAGENPAQWTEIIYSTMSVDNGLLVNWPLTEVLDGLYTLKLTVNELPASGDDTTTAAIVQINLPPAPPQELTVVDNLLDEGGVINLLWSKSIDDGDNDNDLQEYLIYRSTVSGSYNYGQPYAILPAGTTFYQDSSVLTGQPFYYQMRSYDGVWYSANSSEKEGIALDNQPPSAPKNVLAVPGDGKLNLSWDLNSELDIRAYLIYRSTDNLNYQYLTLLYHPVNNYLQTELTNDLTYYFKLQATDVWNNQSPFSGEVHTFPYAGADLEPPAAITDLVVRTGESAGEVVLSWTAPGDDGVTGKAVSYNIRYTVDANFYWESYFTLAEVWQSLRLTGGEAGFAETEVVSGLKEGVTCYFCLRSVDNASNWSANSNLGSASAQVDLTLPAAPQNLAASDVAEDFGSAVNLSWQKSADDGSGADDVAGYRVYRSTNAALGSFSLVVSLTKGRQNYQDSGLNAGEEYYYLVRAYDQWQESPPSNLAKITPLNNWLPINPDEEGNLLLEDGTEVSFEKGSFPAGEKYWVLVKKLSAGEYAETGISAKVRATNVVRDFSLLTENQRVQLQNKSVAQVREFVESNAEIKFKKLVTIKLPYQEVDLSRMKEENLRLYYWNTEKNKWTIINTSQVDRSNKKVSAKVSHFSIYRVMEFLASGDLLDKKSVYTYPNPAKGGSVTFKYYLGEKADVSIDVYNVAGEKVAELKGGGEAGLVSETVWEIKNIASGVYIYHLEARSAHGKAEVMKKLAVLH